jgi:hypothetical protein
MRPAEHKGLTEAALTVLAKVGGGYFAETSKSIMSDVVAQSTQSTEPK